MFASFSFDVQPSMEQDLIFSDFVLKINLIKEKTTFSENCPSHPKNMENHVLGFFIKNIVSLIYLAITEYTYTV